MRQRRALSYVAIWAAAVLHLSTPFHGGNPLFVACPAAVTEEVPSSHITRGLLRPLLLMLLPSSPVVSGALQAGAVDSWTCEVGPGKTYSTVTQALQAAPLDASTLRILVSPGTYRERVAINPGPAVFIEASNGGAEIIWETAQPYESTVAALPGASLTLRNFRIRHASKSVANNYAVFCQSASLTLEECNVTSTTGAGVAAEGGRLVLRDIAVADCARQGLVLLGPLFGGEPLRVDGCGISLLNNGNYFGDGDAIRGPFDGLLARSGVEATLANLLVQGSGKAGVALFDDAAVKAPGAALRNNKAGDSKVSGGDLDLSGTRGAC